jgi:hypothetical protein
MQKTEIILTGKLNGFNLVELVRDGFQGVPEGRGAIADVLLLGGIGKVSPK